MYDYCNDLLPLSFRNLWATNAERRNRENTVEIFRNLRNDKLLHVPFVRLEHFMTFPLAEYPRLWNDFNNYVLAPNRNTFKTKNLKNIYCITYPSQ
jgi:hypothetical protein